MNILIIKCNLGGCRIIQYQRSVWQKGYILHIYATCDIRGHEVTLPCVKGSQVKKAGNTTLRQHFTWKYMHMIYRLLN